MNLIRWSINLQFFPLLDSFSMPPQVGGIRTRPPLCVWYELFYWNSSMHMLHINYLKILFKTKNIWIMNNKLGQQLIFMLFYFHDIITMDFHDVIIMDFPDVTTMHFHYVITKDFHDVITMGFHDVITMGFHDVIAAVTCMLTLACWCSIKVR